jgi:SAM-dependent methyltransferase
MNLYNLVALRQLLFEAMAVDPVIEELTVLRGNFENILLQVNDINEEHKQYIQNNINTISHAIETTMLQANKLPPRIEQINQEINEITHKLFANNYELEQHPGSIESIRINRRIAVPPDTEQDVKQRIMLHTSWRYPAMEIGCRDGEWSQYMVAADPLYLVDPYQDFLDTANCRFTPEYQARLRKYRIRNHDLSALPQNQMSFVFSWGYFNYVSMDTVKLYLRQIFDLLRPGGVFMFSYNNGDTTHGAGMAESFSQTYMPKSLLIPLCESLGYTIHSAFDQHNLSWLEIQQPGHLHTVKAHQVMGEIKYQER